MPLLRSRAHDTRWVRLGVQKCGSATGGQAVVWGSMFPPSRPSPSAMRIHTGVVSLWACGACWVGKEHSLQPLRAGYLILLCSPQLPMVQKELSVQPAPGGHGEEGFPWQRVPSLGALCCQPQQSCKAKPTVLSAGAQVGCVGPWQLEHQSDR